MLKKVKIGIVGCGCISKAYFDGARKFDILEVVGCADIIPEAAQEKAEEYGVKAMTVDELMADPEIEIVINLTIPKVHAAIALQALENGKNVHCEKPLAVTREEGRKVIETAKQKGLLVGCAPDTFLGAGLQTSRKLLEDGWIGKPLSGTAMFMGHGPEAWHPNPAFFYELGGGPMFDLGPYYLTALVHLLGPVKRLCAMTTKGFEERIAGHESIRGKKLPVEVPTNYSGVLEFHNGAIINMITSFDVWGHGHSPIELYGTEGSMKVPDPNTFGGPVTIKRERGDWIENCLSHIYAENSRSIGAADMAYALRTGRKHRCNGDLAFHVLDIMHTFEDSYREQRFIELESTCEQPAPLPTGLMAGFLDE